MEDSDFHPQNENGDELELSDELRRMEKMLGNMRPAGPRPAFVRRVEARLESEQGQNSRRGRGGASLFGNHPVLSAAERRRRRWSRVVPLGIAALVTLSGMVLLHHLAKLPPADRTASHSEPVDAAAGGAQSEPVAPHFVEVSSERSLRNVEEEDIVVVDGMGPMRPVLLHYETAQCWVDPDTQTSVQVIVPWEEMIFYPVSTY